MNPAIFVNVSTNPGATPAPGKATPAREVIRYDDFVRKLLKPDTPERTALHIGLGVTGELAELLVALGTEHLQEELGDIEFYTQAAHNFYGTTVVDLLPHLDLLTVPTVEEQVWGELIKGAGMLADAIKREYIYGKPREISVVLTALAHIHQGTNGAYSLMNTNRPHILQCNALKLEIRYAKLVYSDQAAIARADKPAGE